MQTKSLPVLLLCAFLACCLLLPNAAAAEADTKSAYKAYLATGEIPSLCAAWADQFFIGAAVSLQALQDKAILEAAKTHFNSLTCENEMKAESVMDYQATLLQGDDTRVALNMAKAEPLLAFARENGMKVRAHTLVWHNQTPDWFFREGFKNTKDAPYASRETMLLRMENYIRDVMAWCEINFPGLIYAWDVVNEAIEPSDRHPLGYRTKNNGWYATLGDDWIKLAFTFARRYAAPGQELFYNDYNCYQPEKAAAIRMLLSSLLAEGLVDGIGMQSHITMDYPFLPDYEKAMKAYAAMGLTVQVTELDVNTQDGTAAGQTRLAARYKRLFALLQKAKGEGVPITSVTFWGVSDKYTWLTDFGKTSYPLLFDGDVRPKPAFFGALLDLAIP